MTELTLELVNKLFRYDKETGDLIRKVNKGTAKAGDKAGAVNGSGYLLTTIEGVKYRNHRIIFLMHHGFLPACLDHIDNNKLNNRIENLRPATPSQNQCNSGMRKDNTSGVKGVTWFPESSKWRVQIKYNGKRHCYGLYNTLLEATTVIHKAREKLHGEFVNHGVCEEF